MNIHSNLEIHSESCSHGKGGIFKSKEGCTPTEWREEQVANAAPDDEKQD